ncbi:MAG: thioredoxin domain-containing protein [Candidatus Limnocylindrales bacterium]
MSVNHLAGETSPYLLQHAHNPVDWYPWGPEALARARTEDRPIFLSIGYAACHWCHVMERESFEDPRTAARLNAEFVPIKVDREERPDLDAIYMAAVQAMTGLGGWPMSVFLTPEGRPFYGGTYFPAARGLGIPAFGDVLQAVSAAWRERRSELEALAEQLSASVAASSRLALREDPEGVASPARPGADGVGGAVGAAPGDAAGPPPWSATADQGREPVLPVRPADHAQTVERRLLARAVTVLASSFDRVNGGWGGAPKFPQPAVIELLLAWHVASGDALALASAERSLYAMASGGIHDQVGGGFHRYSTDARWLVPHFEKMLYDNAQLARAYVHAFALTGNPRHARVAGRTLDYLRREMTTPEGLFAASQDADTDGVEGATYTWTRAELEDALGSDGPLVADALGATAEGNWDGRNVLYRARDVASLAALHGLDAPVVEARLGDALQRLLAVRAQRPQPLRDGKALAAWNGLAIAALADSGRVLGRAEDLAAAIRAADAALRLLRDPDGRLMRSWKDGRAVLPGYLEDYALLADGLLALYEATFDERWFAAARQLADVVLALFAEPAGGFWDTAADHEALFVRPRQLEDGAIPSGGAAASLVLLRLAALTGEGRYRATATAALPAVAPLAANHPTAFATWLRAIELASAVTDEVAIVGRADDPRTRALLEVATRGLHPHRVVAVSSDPGESRIELLQSRFSLRGSPTAFVCRDFSCRQPVTEPEALAAQLVE